MTWARRRAIDVHDETAAYFLAEYSSENIYDSPFRYGRCLIDALWWKTVAELGPRAHCLDIGCGIGAYMTRLIEISNAWNRTKHGEYADRILPTFPADLAEYATRRLRINGIQVLTGVGTKSATGTSVELNDGTVIPTSTIVATIGNGPHPLVEASLRLRR